MCSCVLIFWDGLLQKDTGENPNLSEGVLWGHQSSCAPLGWLLPGSSRLFKATGTLHIKPSIVKNTEQFGLKHCNNSYREKPQHAIKVGKWLAIEEEF